MPRNCRGELSCICGTAVDALRIINILSVKREQEVGERKGGSYRDALEKDMTAVRVSEKDADNRKEWREIICCGNP